MDGNGSVGGTVVHDPQHELFVVAPAHIQQLSNKNVPKEISKVHVFQICSKPNLCPGCLSPFINIIHGPCSDVH